MHSSPLSRRPLRATLTSTLLCGALVLTGGAAQADDRDRHRDRDHDRGRSSVPRPGTPKVLVDGLLSPLSLSVDDEIYVSQDFAGRIDRVRRGTAIPVVTSDVPGQELGSVSTDDDRLFYTTSVGAATPDFAAHLWTLDLDDDDDDRDRDDDDDDDDDDDRDRKRDRDRDDDDDDEATPRRLADLGQHERTENPDGDVMYGFTETLDAACAATLPPFLPPGPYPGGLDSHPYASTPSRGEILVADAGANAILSVDRRGDVDTLAVLPPVPLELTAEIATGLGLDPCVAGSTVLLESVPTDVEVGKDGWIYATSLPGGGEGPGVPALGSVYKIHPKSGEVRLVARGFVSATNLAIGGKGEIYVTELFANRVSVVPRGSSTPQPFLELILPAAVEYDDGALYVTTEALPGEGAPPSGKVVKVPLKR